MTPSRSLFLWTTLLSFLFTIVTAVALPDDDDRKWARHVTKTVTVTAASIQTCSTPQSFVTTSSHSSTTTSCPSVAAQITKTVTATSTVTETSRPTIVSTAKDPKIVTVTKTDTVTSVLSGLKGSTTPSTVTVTRTVASNAIASAATSTVTVTAPLPGTAATVTATVTASANTVTITQTRPQSDITTTITATASTSTDTVTVTSDIPTTVTATTTFTTTPSAAACTNPLLNPGFEAGTQDWTFSQQNPGISFTTQPSSSIPGGGAHSGSSAGAFVSNGGPFLPGIPSVIYQTVTTGAGGSSCAASGKYQISMFVKTAANQCFISVFNDLNAASPVLSVQISPGGASPVWEEVVAPVAMPLQSGVAVVFSAACNTQDTVWFDDF